MIKNSIIALLILIILLIRSPLEIFSGIKHIYTSLRLSDIFKGGFNLEYIKTGVPVLNLLLVIFFFRSERRYKNNMLRFERKSFWYRKIFIEKGYETINKSIDSLRDEKIYNKNLPEDEYKNNLRKTFKRLKKEIDDVVDSLRVMDPEFGDELMDQAYHLEDSAMNKSIVYFYSESVDIESIYNVIKKNRIAIFKLLYQYESEDYRTTHSKTSHTKMIKGPFSYKS